MRPSIHDLRLSLLLVVAACGGPSTPPAAPAAPEATTPVAPAVLHVGAPPCAGAAACTAQCDAGDARACWVASELYIHYLVPGEPEDTRGTAIELLEKGCAAGDLWQCGLVSMHYYFGDSQDLYFYIGREGAEQTYAQYEERFPKIGSLGKAACDAGFGIGCEMVARTQADTDPAAAIPLFERANEIYGRECDEGEPLSCLALSGSLAGELPVAMPSDPERSTELWIAARTLYEGACDAGDAAACRRAGDMWFPRPGSSLPSDEEKAEALRQRACTFVPDAYGCAP